MTIDQFDPHAIIRSLAEAEWECPGDGVAGRGGSVEHSLCHCTRCDDTSRSVPFELLRVERQGVFSHRDCRVYAPCDLQLADGTQLPGTQDCRGRGWVPQPDVREAWLQLIAQLTQDRTFTDAFWAYTTDPAIASVEEAVFRAAEVWLREESDARNTERLP